MALSDKAIAKGQTYNKSSFKTWHGVARHNKSASPF
jgi:hypothetical protein